MAEEKGLPQNLLDEWIAAFSKEDSRVLSQKACMQFPTLPFLNQRDHTFSHVFNTNVTPRVKPVSNQKESGRCWIYATLSMLRIYFAREKELEEFEFSQTYLFFWDKVERCNYLLSSFIKLAKEGGGPTENRTLHHLLKNPTNDGGQWRMVVNLIEKYGVIPNRHWKSPYLAENSSTLGDILNNQLRLHCATLVNMVKSGASDEELRNRRLTMMNSIFNTISTCLGSPPQMFEYDFYDKNEKYHKIGPISPQQFYREFVKPLINLEDMVCLTNDPRNTSPYNKLYTVAYLNNMENAPNVVYANLPVAELKKYARIALENNQPVWFGCDVDKEFNQQDAVLALDQFDYKRAFGIDIRGLDKADRLVFLESEMTHAMILTGCNVEDENGERVVSKWRVENSYGKLQNDGKGHLVMTDDWFTEHTYEVIINRKYLPDDILEILLMEPIELPAWDPMGALA